MRFLAERTQFRRDRVVVPIARKHLLPDPLFFRCIFSGRSRRSERHVQACRPHPGSTSSWALRSLGGNGSGGGRERAGLSPSYSTLLIGLSPCSMVTGSLPLLARWV